MADAFVSGRAADHSGPVDAVSGAIVPLVPGHPGNDNLAGSGGG